MLHAPHHHPPHILKDNSIYFITARTVSDFRQDSTIKYFNTDQKKNIFYSVLKEAKNRFKIALYAWVLLDNHYHMLLKIKNSHNLSKFIQNLHTNSARLLNLLDKKPNRKIWYQYWDHCIRSEKDFYQHFNYIHNNPIKHKKVKDLEELPNYEFSSFGTWLNKKGKEWIYSCFEKYPIIDFTTNDD